MAVCCTACPGLWLVVVCLPLNGRSSWSWVFICSSLCCIPRDLSCASTQPAVLCGMSEWGLREPPLRLLSWVFRPFKNPNSRPNGQLQPLPTCLPIASSAGLRLWLPLRPRWLCQPQWH